MITLIGSIAAVLLVLAGLMLTISQHRTARRLFVAAIVVAISGTVLDSQARALFGNTGGAVVVALAGLLTLLGYFIGPRGFRYVWAAIVTLWTGMLWLTTTVIGFVTGVPVALYPQPERFLVTALGSVGVLGILALAIEVIGYLRCDTPLAFERVAWLCAPLLAAIVIGLIGRFRYLRIERRGLHRV